MDAYSGYNQIWMSVQDESKTAFFTNHGIYYYQVIPFGLKNAGATYQRLVNRMFTIQLGKTMEIYVDDMLTKSVTSVEHARNLRETFIILRQYRMRLNLTKCAFDVSSKKFFSFMVHQRGVEANLDKIKMMIDLHPPRKTKEVHKFNNIIVFLSHFISKLTDQCLPFFKALKKKGDFSWTLEC
ncbi:hypothetical protein Q3G72_019523 [Acer saccharum]|nr:hypothetical protein Q3G72_019523 [Acer saccharum]